MSSVCIFVLHVVNQPNSDKNKNNNEYKITWTWRLTTARSAATTTTTKSATKKKISTTSKPSKKTASSKSSTTKAEGKKSTKSDKLTKSTKSTKATKSTKSSKTRKVAKKKKVLKAKPKSFFKSLSKSDQKLLKKYPDPARPKRPAPVTYFLAIEQVIMPTPKELGGLWKELDESSKLRYKKKYSSQLPEYKNKLSNYNKIKEQSVQEWLETIKQLNQERPPQTGYLGYVKENKSEFQGSRNFGENVKVMCI